MPTRHELRRLISAIMRLRQRPKAQQDLIGRIKTASRDLNRYNLMRCVIEMVSDRDDLTEADLSALILMLRAKTINDLTPERTQWEAHR